MTISVNVTAEELVEILAGVVQVIPDGWTPMNIIVRDVDSIAIPGHFEIVCGPDPKGPR